MKSWLLKDESSKRRETYEDSCLKAFCFSSNADTASKLFSQGPLACYMKKKLPSWFLTHLHRTDKQKFTKAVWNKINSEPFRKFSQIQQHFLNGGLLNKS